MNSPVPAHLQISECAVFFQVVCSEEHNIVTNGGVIGQKERKEGRFSVQVFRNQIILSPKLASHRNSVQAASAVAIFQMKEVVSVL